MFAVTMEVTRRLQAWWGDKLDRASSPVLIVDTV